MRKCTSAIQSIYQKNQDYIQRNEIITGYKDKEPIVKSCDPKTKALLGPLPQQYKQALADRGL